MDEQPQPDTANLWRIAAGSLVLALLAGAAFWMQIESGGGMGWVGWLIVGTLTMIIYSILFYFGHRYLEDSLDQYIVSDKFVRRNKWIDVETETRESGDGKIDGWVAHFKFIRTIFAMGLLPLIASIYIFWFA